MNARLLCVVVIACSTIGVASQTRPLIVDREDTVRTNFYSQAAGSTGTLTHPIAQKIADRIKDARLK